MEYAQARIQARFGCRPRAADWLRMQAASDLSAALDIAERSALGRWTAGLGTRSGAHEIERAIRDRLRGLISEVARWVPREWRSAVAVLEHLLDLRPLALLAAGGTAQAWMHADEQLAPLAGADDLLERLEAGPYGYLARAWRLPRAAEGAAAGLHERALRAWLEEWRSRWPAQDADQRDATGRLAGLVLRHVEALSRARPQDSRALHRALLERLLVSFRRGAGTPVAPLAFLALEALDGARVRAELLRHAALAPAGIEP